LALIAITVAAFFVSTASSVAASAVDSQAKVIQATTSPTINETVTAPTIHVSHAILIDMSSGRVLYSSNPDDRCAIGSTTKIMTAILVLESLPLDRLVTVSPRAASVGEQSLGLKAGDQLTVEQLLYGALVHSGNDASCALAEACSGSIESFVSEMNAKASELGLKNTHFANPDGLDAPGHYSSARDLATLARYAMQNSEFRKIVGTESYSITLRSGSAPFTFHNVNRLLGSASWVTGVKTGFTNDAHFCLVASGSNSGASVISVVLGESNWTNTYADGQKLLEYGFKLDQLSTVSSGLSLDNSSSVQSLSLGGSSVVAQATVPCGGGESVKLVTTGSATLTVPAGAQLSSTLELPKTVSTPMAKGSVLGHVVYEIQGKVVASINVVAAQAISKPTLARRMAYCCGGLAHRVANLF
jgi:D-alanyl-D-alanine carboxypeptidase (penicillin-binding protein 5/6)